MCMRYTVSAFVALFCNLFAHYRVLTKHRGFLLRRVAENSILALINIRREPGEGSAGADGRGDIYCKIK